VEFRECIWGEMKNLLAAVLLAGLSISAWAQAPAAKPVPKIKVGDMAPDFTLLSFDGKDVKPVSLHDFKGKKNVVLAFYVFAFTGG
jgi:cytochrome oxidase Cu insertion factor (SCO1/SenC/PrrC family)